METLNELLKKAEEELELTETQIKDNKKDIKKLKKLIETLEINNLDSSKLVADKDLLIGYQKDLEIDYKIQKSIIRRLTNIKKTYTSQI